MKRTANNKKEDTESMISAVEERINLLKIHGCLIEMTQYYFQKNKDILGLTKERIEKNIHILMSNEMFRRDEIFEGERRK